MSHQEPTDAEIASAAASVEDIEVDDPDFLATLDVGCLGCMLQAKLGGRISEELYDAIMEQTASLAKQGKVTCPECGGIAYVSTYDPDMAHCPDCGAYLGRSPEDTWSKFYQGITLERRA